MEKSSLGASASPLPPIPAKRYFTIGEVADLCQVKPYVLRYWEQEFTQLKPMKRRGNRRYYQHHEVLLIRRIRDLLYEQGFTIVGARNRLGDQHNSASTAAKLARAATGEAAMREATERDLDDMTVEALALDQGLGSTHAVELTIDHMRSELLTIRRLLG